MITCETEYNKVSFVKLLTFFIDFTYDIYIIKRNSCNFLPEYSFKIVSLSLLLLLRINHLSQQHHSLPTAQQQQPADTSLRGHHSSTLNSSSFHNADEVTGRAKARARTPSQMDWISSKVSSKIENSFLSSQYDEYTYLNIIMSSND